MKYMLLDGENVNVGGCVSCPLSTVEVAEEAGVWKISCNYPGHEGQEIIEGEILHDHYLNTCPLSPYQSLHHLYVSAKCIYQTVKTLYENFRVWWSGRKSR